MKRFFLMTRGRTGSTAIVDELNNLKGVFAEQEIFRKGDFRDALKEPFMQDFQFQFAIPFDLWKLWKTQGSWWRQTWKCMFDNRQMAGDYLRDLEEIMARRKDASAFGFKALSHHFIQKPFLKKVLIGQGYRAIYLTRNIPRQVISGMIAKQRGVYNQKDYKDDGRYRIDIDEFERSVVYGTRGVQKDMTFLRRCGFDFIEVSYEDFTADREAFFARVLEFLDIAFEVPKASDYSVMIKDLRHTVENYDAILKRASAMGLEIA